MVLLRMAASGWVIAAVLAGCSRAPAPPAPRAVSVVVVAPRDVGASSRYSASLAPWEQIELGFAVPGKVRSLAEVEEAGRRRLIQEGDPVRQGAPLASLDDSDFRMKARAAAATLQSAAVQQGATEIAFTQASVELARARKLSGAGAIPPAELERAEAALAAARANVDVTKAQRLATSEQNALARSAVDDTRLVSPIDGVLARRLIDVGESVAPGTVAFTVIDTTRLRVVFGVPGHQLSVMKIGRKIPVRVEGLPGDALVGTISKVLPMADPLLRSFSVELMIANPDNALRPGMVASIATDGDALGPVILVPLEAVVRGPSSLATGDGGFAVWVVTAGGGEVALRAVELSDLLGNDVVVTAGLGDGDVVVTRGAQLLREGEPVEVVP